MDSSLDRVLPRRGRNAGAFTRVRRERIVAVYLFVVSSLTAAAILWAGRGTTFFSDEWEFVVVRRGWTLDTFFGPHGEHVVVLPVVLYKTLFETVGLNAYWPYRCVLLLVHLACVWLVFRLAGRRVGDPAAALAASFVLVLGSAWEMLLVPFELTLLGSVALGLLALDGLDRGGRRGEVVALLALIGATASSSAGIAFVAGVTAELVLRRAWRGCGSSGSRPLSTAPGGSRTTARRRHASICSRRRTPCLAMSSIRSRRPRPPPFHSSRTRCGSCSCSQRCSSSCASSETGRC